MQVARGTGERRLLSDAANSCDTRFRGCLGPVDGYKLIAVYTMLLYEVLVIDAEMLQNCCRH